MPDKIFLHVEAGAHTGANGFNPLPEPTEAQARAGNYKMGRVVLHGLAIAIENPRNTYRRGRDKNGKEWACRMAAHYGYLSGTKGNDGDGIDCFVGPVPQSEAVFVINQVIAGRFDEHKVMLGFLDAEDARRAYLHSYERGWTGLDSLIPLSISQLKGWLRHGNKSRPLSADQLPHEGNSTMTQGIAWNADALPVGQTLDHVLYDMRRDDGADRLLLDAATAVDILEDADGVLALDAMVVPFAKLETKLNQLYGIMERTGGEVKPVAMQITEPFKQRGVSNVAVIFELSDGQTLSIYFHNPDVNPAKLTATDELISWKWLLNKKDCTIVVAPERGVDLNPREVARRMLKLAAKNSAAFARVNAKRAETMGRIDGLKTEIAALEIELKDVQHELEVAKVEAETKPAVSTTPLHTFTNAETGMESYVVAGTGQFAGKFNAVLKDLDSGEFVPTGYVNMTEEQAIAKAKEIVDFKESGQKETIDPTSPEGYAKIMADPALQLEYQDVLDNFFQERAVAIRNALRAAGWEGDQDGKPHTMGLSRGFSKRVPGENGAENTLYTVNGDYKQVGAGANIVSIAWDVRFSRGYGDTNEHGDAGKVADDLTKTPEQIAGDIDALAVPAVGNESDPYAGATSEYLKKELARMRDLLEEAKDAGLTPITKEQFMQEIGSGNRSGFSEKELTEKLASLKSDLAGVNAGAVTPRSVVGKGGKKADAIKWLEGMIAEVEFALSDGGFLYSTNVGNYNYMLRDLIKNGSDTAFKSDEQRAKEEAEQKAYREQKDSELAALKAKADASKNYHDGEYGNMRDPLEFKFTVSNDAYKIIADLAGLRNPQERYDYLDNLATAGNPYVKRQDIQFNKRVEFNSAVKNGATFGYFEIAPRVGYCLVTCIIDLRGASSPEITPQQRQNNAFVAVFDALVANHGWSREDGTPGGTFIGSAKKMFDGLGPKGTAITPNGERRISVWNRQGSELIATLGDTVIVTEPVSPDAYDAAASAARINDAVEAFVGREREKRSNKKPSKMDALPAIKTMRAFMSAAQISTVGNAMRGEEAQFFIDKMIELAKLVETMPKTYGQDGKGDQAVAYLHYFVGGADWYITERDMEDEQLQAFGLADLGQGFPEIGYINIDEITKAGAELDFHWTPKTLAEIKGKETVEPQPDPEPAPPAEDPAKAAAKELMQSIVDGTADPLTADLDALEAAYTANADDAEIAALFEKAVEVVLAAVGEATKGV